MPGSFRRGKAPGFACPLRGECLAPTEAAFPTYRSCNQAVADYRNASDPDDRGAQALEIFRRLLPSIRKTLRRFCPPTRLSSRCVPGGCLPEELVGESYLAFREVLDRYEPNRGVDFVGYVSQRLYWKLEHRSRPLERAAAEISAVTYEEPVVREDEEGLILRKMLADELLSGLEPGEAELMVRDAAGHSCEEIAEWAGVSSAAVRKRLERIRRRLRRVADAD